MTHTFKLARRIARFKPSRKRPSIHFLSRSRFQRLPAAGHLLAAAVLVALVTGCSEDKLGDITSSSQPEPDPALAKGGRGKQIISLVVSPDTAKLATQQSRQFSASALRSDSVSTSIAVVWSATGGTIDGAGKYTAGKTPGDYRIVAKQKSGSLADTARVTVTTGSGAVQSVILTPDSTSLTMGATKVFAAVVKLADGTTSTQPVTYKATGGSIDSSGTYTAGNTAGKYQVTATFGSGPADTSTVTITAGSATCASTATMLCPGDNLQAKATAAGGGATLTLQPGIYRLQTLTPLTGQTFQGQPGAILSGARLLSGWTQSGATWYVGGQTQQGTAAGQCEAGYLCQEPEDVYRDDVLLRRVGSAGAVTPGTFFFDYAADRIYVGDNPTGHVVEVAVTPYAFEGTGQGVGSGVTIRGLVIEKYATPAQMAAVGHGGTGANWVIRDNEIRFNHGIGVRTGAGAQIIHNNIHHNGQMGAGGGGNNVLFENNEVAYNNAAHYDYGWEGGGTKFVQSQGFVARGNFAHHNRGPGLWWDGDNDGALIEQNRVEDNVADGIFWEISYSATIRNNSLSRNGFGRVPGSEGAGILLNSSGAPAGKILDVYGNTLVGNKEGIIGLQADRGSGRLGPWVVQNLSVHDNVIQLGPGGQTGIDRYSGTAPVWTTLNNRFEHNTYNLQTAPASPFIWAAAYRTDAQWQAYGNDDSGTFNR
jgi:parallel beta-helix repeat protein